MPFSSSSRRYFWLSMNWMLLTIFGEVVLVRAASAGHLQDVRQQDGRRLADAEAVPDQRQFVGEALDDIRKVAFPLHCRADVVHAEDQGLGVIFLASHMMFVFYSGGTAGHRRDIGKYRRPAEFFHGA